MAQAKKKASKKATRKTATAKAKATASANLPQGSDIPEGMQAIGGGYAPSWKPENVGDQLHGEVTSEVRTVEQTIGRKKAERRVVEVTNESDGARWSVWESAALGALFDHLAETGPGPIVFIRFDGLGKAKRGQNAPKLFTVAIAE